MKTITIAFVRAEDIPAESYVRQAPRAAQFHSGGDWSYVYAIARGETDGGCDGSEDMEKIHEHLDHRHVVMRLSKDKKLSIPSVTSAGTTRQRIESFVGDNYYDDHYVVSRSYDLWEIQIVNEKED